LDKKFLVVDMELVLILIKENKGIKIHIDAEVEVLEERVVAKVRDEEEISALTHAIVDFNREEVEEMLETE